MTNDYGFRPRTLRLLRQTVQSWLAPVSKRDTGEGWLGMSNAKPQEKGTSGATLRSSPGTRPVLKPALAIAVAAFHRNRRRLLHAGVLLLAFSVTVVGTGESAWPDHTSLSDPTVRYVTPKQHYVVLQRAGVEAIIVDNHAVDDAKLPEHRAGYSGLASLKHTARRENLFVQTYAGLNFEHIHDGRTLDRKILFEPRNAAMQLRQVDEHTVELYQPPTPTWKLESCHRYALLPDGVIELTVEVIPREQTFENEYVGLFWASYIAQPESLDIHFRGLRDTTDSAPTWIRGETPQHGVRATHLKQGDVRVFARDADFPLTLVFNESPYRYTEDWYYGVSHQMAWVMMFRPRDQIRFAQSPSGGGEGNPAWDFQAFLSPYKLNQVYRLVTRAMYVPFESVEQLEELSRPHRTALAAGDK